MAEYNSPIAVGLAQPSPMIPVTKWAPVTGNISQNPSTWGYGGTNLYPAPFRSFYQQTQQNTYSLGPYARRIDNGLSGRIKMSVVDYPGEMGFVQQCWYDFPRGAFDTDDNGDIYPENREFWAQSEKAIVIVKDLMSNAGDIVVEVAISNRTAADPNVWWFLAPMSGAIANHVHAVINVFTGQGFNGMPGDTSTCGTNDSSGQQRGSLMDLSFSDGNGWGGFRWLFAAGGLADNIFGAMFNGLTPAAQAALGPEFDDNNRANTLGGWITDHLNALGDFLDKLRDAANPIVAISDQATRDQWNDRIASLLTGIGTAADLMINGWFIPNLLQSTSNSQYGDNTTGTSANPYQWRPSDRFQQRLAWGMEVDSNTGLPSGDKNLDGVVDSRDYVAQSTGFMPDANGNELTSFLDADWEHFLTLLNRGDNTTMPYIDTATNEWVFHENYGFNRGGSISDMDGFLDAVEQMTNQQTADSLAALIDMSPANFVFLGAFVPIVVLEAAARLIKTNRGEAIGATNLDAYVNTKIEVRISAANMSAGNPAMYNYLLNNGDHLGNTFTAVP